MVLNILITIGICLVPIFELRLGIPYALYNKLNPFFTYFLCIISNALVGPLVFIFLSTMHKLLRNWSVYQKFFEKIIERTRKKISKYVEKYGYIGIALFVAIPLPITGAYTGALGAWVLGMKKRKTFLAVALGVAIAGIIVTIVYLSGSEILKRIFIKAVH